MARAPGCRDARKAPLRNRAGEIIGLLTHHRDISERKRIRDEVAQSRRRLNDAMEHMADGLAMFDQRLPRLVHEQYRTMFSKTTELRVRAPGLRISARVVERGEQTDIAPGAVDTWIEYTLANFTKAGETDIQMGDGRWIRARVSPTDDGGSLTLMTDVTRIKHAEAVLTDVN